MKINKTKIVFKIVRMIKGLEPEEWIRIKSTVDDVYFDLRLLEKPEECNHKDDIEEIEEEIEDNKC